MNQLGPEDPPEDQGQSSLEQFEQLVDDELESGGDDDDSGDSNSDDSSEE